MADVPLSILLIIWFRLLFRYVATIMKVDIQTFAVVQQKLSLSKLSRQSSWLSVRAQQFLIQ